MALFPQLLRIGVRRCSAAPASLPGAKVVEGAVMNGAERDRPFVADPAAPAKDGGGREPPPATDIDRFSRAGGFWRFGDQSGVQALEFLAKVGGHLL